MLAYRDKPEVLDALDAQAHLRHRSTAQELRLAVRLWLFEAQLAQLRDPVGRAEAERQGFDVAADEKMVRERIAKLKREAFAVPKPTLREALADAVPV
jgi:hypothetical protein